MIARLLDNARKFSAGRAEPRIEVSAIDDGYCVADNGAGFDPAYADKLFGLFQRLHGADEFPGLGSGLAIARLLIERQGGWIRGEARPGAGARFSFGLPPLPPAPAGSG